MPTQAAQQAAGSPGLGMLTTFLPLILLFVLLWFFMFRPQQRQQKERQQMLSALAKGDEVVTTAGIHGVVVNLSDQLVTLRLADNQRIVFDRSAIARIERNAPAKESQANAQGDVARLRNSRKQREKPVETDMQEGQ
ncbi:MAG: preprotein translocase subunit YajC [Firmicutes bacterium]|nr:preprotein translocase subunit YajC [Bacillota bacterium]